MIKNEENRIRKKDDAGRRDDDRGLEKNSTNQESFMSHHLNVCVCWCMRSSVCLLVRYK